MSIHHSSSATAAWPYSALLAACSFAACRSAAPESEKPPNQSDISHIAEPIEQMTGAPNLPKIPDQTLSTLRETYGQIVRADKSTSPLLTQGIDRFFKAKEEIKISVSAQPVWDENATITVTAENYSEHKLLVYQYCLQERLRNNVPLAALFDSYAREPQLSTRVDAAIVRGVRRSPDNLITGYFEALSIFAENDKPIGTIRDLRGLLTSVNANDGPAMNIVMQTRRLILEGKSLELTSNAPDGSVPKLIVTAENIEQHRVNLNSAMFSMRQRDNLMIQSLVAKEEYGELDPIERIVLKALRNHPDDITATYKEAELMYLAAAREK